MGRSFDFAQDDSEGDLSTTVEMTVGRGGMVTEGWREHESPHKLRGCLKALMLSY
jgi:hypothetical protein